MKRRFLTLIFTITAMLTCIFGLSACGKVASKVNFLVDGEVYATLSTNGKEVIKMPENPTKDDYVFDGWYWDKDTWKIPFTANSLLDAPLSSDMSVYCKWKPKQEESGDETKGEETNTGLLFKTLTVDGTNVYGKVSNATETFSFKEEVSAYGLSKFIVALDIYGAQQVATKTIALNVGDNTAYVIETIDGEAVKVYTVTVRRRPTYTVSFDSNGGTAVQSQQVEEDSFARVPETTPERLGYTFKKWDYDFSQSVTDNLNITAEWQANTDTKYRVEYYLQNLANDYYTLQNSETENLTGTTDTTATAEIKTFEHFTYKTGSTESGKINADGSTVLKVYYTRDTYTVTFDGNGGTRVSGSERQTVKYGGSVTAPEYVKTGYTFKFDKTNLTNISESFTVTAKWTINQYTLTIVYGNGQENKEIKQDYNTPIESIANPESRAGYDFIRWDKTIPTIMPAENLTITAKWNAIFTLSKGTVTGLTDYGENNYIELNIPSKIDGVTITSISQSAFYNCSSLTSVTIPDSVTSIGSCAFYNCSSLTSVNIPNSVTSIGFSAFEDCSSLSSITIPNNVTSIGDYAFIGCSSLTSVTIPDSVTSIGDRAFEGCSSLQYNVKEHIEYLGNAKNPYVVVMGVTGTTLTTYTIDNNAKIIYDSAFEDCSSLTSVTIPDSVTSIGSYAFYDCSSLTSVTISDSVTRIGNRAFEGCSSLQYNVKEHIKYLGNAKNPYVVVMGVTTSLTTYTIDNNAKIIYAYAFAYCSSLTSVTIPDSVTSIGSSAFGYCSGLTSVTIPDSVTSIGYAAFVYCSSLTSVTIPDSVTSISSSALVYCSSLRSITVDANNQSYQSIDGNLYTKDGTTFIQYAIGKTATSFEIPDSVTSIGAGAFYNCSSLTSVTIPDSVTSIGYGAFEYCSSLTSVTIPNSVKSIGSSAFYNCSSLTSVTIPNSVKSIGAGAFYNCSSLTSVTIPDSVTSIGSSAFYDCSSLRSVTIPDSVTSIGDFAFYNCGGLTSMTIGNSVTSIGQAAFYNCSSLTSVTIPDSVTSIGSSAFYNCSSLTSITVDENNQTYKSIDGNLYTKDGTNLIKYAIGKMATTFVIPDSVTSIGYSAFASCSSLRSVTIPNSVTSIGSSAFYGCSSLTSVTIGNGVTSIGDVAFADCSSLTSVTIPDSVTSIGENAFSGCSSLTSVTIPNSVTSIGSSAFYNCSSLTSVTIPDRVTSIGNFAFYNCSSLTSITIPNSVTSIGDYAFGGCRSLTSITFSDTSTWYRTTNYTNWQNKSGGTETNVTNVSQNATYFKSTYDDYYWYKK